MVKLGVQSYCFRGFKDNRTVAKMVKDCGLDRIEICGVHCDFTDTARFKDVISIYKDAGVDICSIGVQGMSNSVDKERKFFEFIKMVGVRLMSVDFDINTVPEAYRTAENLAEEYDVRLAIHNHGARHWLGSSQMLEYVFKNTSDRIGLCLDTAWALDSREDPVQMAEKYKDRLYAVHLKDFVFDRAAKPQDVILGEGNLNLKQLLETLDKNSFSGEAIIEYEGDVNNPVPALKKCVEEVKKAG
jgi:inosose dehydratase